MREQRDPYKNGDFAVYQDEPWRNPRDWKEYKRKRQFEGMQEFDAARRWWARVTAPLLEEVERDIRENGYNPTSLAHIAAFQAILVKGADNIRDMQAAFEKIALFYGHLDKEKGEAGKVTSDGILRATSIVIENMNVVQGIKGKKRRKKAKVIDAPGNEQGQPAIPGNDTGT